MINGIPWNIKKYHRNGVLPKFFYVQIWTANHIVKLSGWSSRTLICANDMLLFLIYGDLGFFTWKSYVNYISELCFELAHIFILIQ